MRRLSIAVSLLGWMIVASPTFGASPTTKLPEPPKPVPAGATASTAVPESPEIWLYQQYQQQYQNPSAMVRQRAELRADQRQSRVESMKWFGLSNARPQASPDNIHNDYSPGWVSNHTAYPYRWCPWYLGRW